MSETRALGEWVAATGLGDLPEDVVHDTKRLILDQLGCQVGCARLPWSRAVLGAIRGLSGSGPATVVVFGDRLPADDSNATQAAQLSIRFATAVAARHGPAVLADLGPGQFNDPEVLDLARRVDVYREPKQERESWMNWGCVTTITTTDRESFTIEMPAPVGSPRNPMTDADVEEKFHGLADPVLGRSRADAIVEAVWYLEDTRPDAELLPLTIA